MILEHSHPVGLCFEMGSIAAMHHFEGIISIRSLIQSVRGNHILYIYNVI